MFSFYGAKPNNCPYCGNNPVPHFINWYFESVNVLLTPLRGILLYNPISRWLKRMALTLNLPFGLVMIGKKLRFISFQEDVTKCKVRRAQVLWEEAQKRGIEMNELLLFGRPFDMYIAESYPSVLSSGSKDKLKAKSCKLVFSGLPRPKSYDNRSLDWMDDKLYLKKTFAKAGLPVPKGGSCWRLRQALKIFSQVQKPVIVKPRTGSRGRHNTTFVSSIQDLVTAFQIAKRLCFWVVVEEHILGPVYRATLINFELCGVLRGDPPQVVGDGRHTVEELIAIKNSQPHPDVKDIVIDETLKRFLSRQAPVFPSPGEGRDQGRGRTDGNNGALFLDYIPKTEEGISLSEKIGVNYGGSSSEDFDICHPDNKELFVRAAKIIGDPIVGFDFIIPDITKSYKGQKCGFIEANSLPFINLHHDPLYGKPRNVATKVWEMIGF